MKFNAGVYILQIAGASTPKELRGEFLKNVSLFKPYKQKNVYDNASDYSYINIKLVAEYYLKYWVGIVLFIWKKRARRIFIC